MQCYKVDTINVALITAALSDFLVIKVSVFRLKNCLMRDVKAKVGLSCFFSNSPCLYLMLVCYCFDPQRGSGGDISSAPNTAYRVFLFSWQSFFLHIHQQVPAYLQFLVILLVLVWQLLFTLELLYKITPLTFWWSYWSLFTQ